MKNFMKVSPLRLLDMASQNRLGPGNLGVLIARAGVGKSACLVHIAFDRIFAGDNLVHISVNETPDKVASYYDVILSDMVKALEMPDEDDLRLMVERNRMILAYMKNSFNIDRLSKSLRNLEQNLSFKPQTLILDGLDFDAVSRQLLEGIRGLTTEFNTETWLSALSHRHKTSVNERGIPYPCDKLDDLFEVIIQLAPTADGVYLRLLKDHSNAVSPEARVRLDPNTFLVIPQ